MLQLNAGYYILDARCKMLNAKVHRAVADCDSGERGLPGSARVSRAGFGFSPEQSCLKAEIAETISEN
jgi:hypothetical protein